MNRDVIPSLKRVILQDYRKKLIITFENKKELRGILPKDSELTVHHWLEEPIMRKKITFLVTLTVELLELPLVPTSLPKASTFLSACETIRSVKSWVDSQN
jgi:hypothetical protein